MVRFNFILRMALQLVRENFGNVWNTDKDLLCGYILIVYFTCSIGGLYRVLRPTKL